MKFLQTAEPLYVSAGDVTIFLRKAGEGPPLLLLHGFPETNLMWRHLVPVLCKQFTVLCADLRGYGESGCPASDKEHIPYSKRVMAQDMVTVMEQLGYANFFIAGHDRGGRVAYRLALDHPQRVNKAAFLDILTTADAWDNADMAFTQAYWPWSFLSQPYPVPEQLALGAPEAIIDDALNHWGTEANIFEPETREAYLKQIKDPIRVHAICEEFRAAAKLDYAHDQHDLRNGRRIHCPTLVLWSKDSLLDFNYSSKGGPVSLWRRWADNVIGSPVAGGHFFPESNPTHTAKLLGDFFSG